MPVNAKSGITALQTTSLWPDRRLPSRLGALPCDECRALAAAAGECSCVSSSITLSQHSGTKKPSIRIRHLCKQAATGKHLCTKSGYWPPVNSPFPIECVHTRHILASYLEVRPYWRYSRFSNNFFFFFLLNAAKPTWLPVLPLISYPCIIKYIILSPSQNTADLKCLS